MNRDELGIKMREDTKKTDVVTDGLAESQEAELIQAQSLDVPATNYALPELDQQSKAGNDQQIIWKRKHFLCFKPSTLQQKPEESRQQPSQNIFILYSVH